MSFTSSAFPLPSTTSPILGWIAGTEQSNCKQCEKPDHPMQNLQVSSKFPGIPGMVQTCTKRLELSGGLYSSKQLAR